jgi:phosphatidylserine/phosphatidylglycerophosphate/cardiolipin synthase-like enzyme
MSTRRILPHSIFNDVSIATGENQINGHATEFVLANGLLVTEYLTNLLEQAQSEVLFCTCFWANSPSLDILRDSLLRLNENARCEGRRVSVRIFFSSYSIRQMFLSWSGTRIWLPRSWPGLGLPDINELDCVDLTVFSQFKKPVGVMHAKFVVIDRSTVVLSSSNISCLSLFSTRSHI